MSLARTDNLYGIVAMLIAVLSFAIMDAMLKILSPHYPALQVAALRGLASLPFVVVWVTWRRAWPAMRHVRLPLHLLRGALSIMMLMTFAYALRSLPLTEAYAIFFVAPLFVTGMAGVILRERIGWPRWIAIAVGLAGVIVVLRPTGSGLASIAGLAVIVSALCYSISAITVRVLGRTDSTLSMVFWMVAMLSVGATVLAWPNWQPVLASHAWVIVGVGVAGTIGQVAVTLAFSRGEASVIAPFEYTALVWGVALDFLLWRTVPGALTFVGAAIVIASGLYLVRTERGVHVEAERP
jgi:drug/metabolite transporter (DMT)-like permease